VSPEDPPPTPERLEALRVEKTRLRDVLRHARSALDPAQRAAAAETIAERLASDADYRAAETIGVYAAVRDELDLGPLCARALQDGKMLAFPRVEGPRLEWRCCRPEALRPGYARIPEPPDEAPVVALDMIDLLLVPALGFDAQGGRLGAGGGFYDRALALARPRGPVLAVGFEVQHCPRVPCAPHDARTDGFVTERGRTPASPAPSPLGMVPPR
jgi:5-formyltetrahydrofolate cyclo-ligase